jgi:hypothetical protein
MNTAEVPSKLPQLHAYVDSQLKKDIERLAKRRRRTVSSLLAYLAQLEVEKAKETGELDENESANSDK